MDIFEISIIKNTYNLYRELYLAIKQFPKSERHALGERCETITLQFLEYLFDAALASKSAKSSHLDRASTKLNVLRIYIRLGKDIRVFNEKMYLKFQSDLDEIGRMLGGWRRSIL